MQYLPDENLPDVCPSCRKDLHARNNAFQLPVGTILAGRYYIGCVIGQGGFGITYTGCDLKLRLKVAVKEYYPQGLVARISEYSTLLTVNTSSEKTLFQTQKERFMEEARLLAEFSDDPHIVRVSDIFEENNTSYIVMEYIEGITLGEYSKQYGTMSFDVICDMLKPAMVTLAKIHADGLIHRDLSPSNIMLRKDLQIKLIDFGSARDFAMNGERSMSIILKPGYAPPEQYNTRGTQGPWGDVYSLCATIYHTITGKTPANSFERLTDDTVPYPSELNAVITEEQEAVLMCGMAVRIEDRISSMDELQEAIAEAAGGSVPEKARPFYRGKKSFLKAAAEKRSAEKEHSRTAEKKQAKDTETVRYTEDENTGASDHEEIHSAVSGRVSALEHKAQPRKKGLSPALIAGAAAGVIILIAAAFMLLRKPKPEPKPPVRESTAAQASEAADTTSETVPVTRDVTRDSADAAGEAPQAGSSHESRESGALSAPERTTDSGDSGTTSGDSTADGAGDGSSDSGAAGSHAAGATDSKADSGAASTADSKADSDSAPSSPAIDWKDDKLEAAMREVLRIPSGDIRLSDVEGLTNLDLCGAEITDISALASLKSLTSLYLANNGISDVSPLAELPELATLDVSRNAIGSADAFSGMKNLKSLDISYNEIKDVSPLESLTNLNSLYILGNQIEDYTPLYALGIQPGRTDEADKICVIDWKNPALEEVIRDAAGVYDRGITRHDLADITDLDLRGKELEDISALGILENLTSLTLSDNRISDITPLSGLTNLEMLDLSRNSLEDISALGNLTNLTALGLSDNKISNVAPLTALSSLKSLYLAGNEISDISPLAKMSGLETLSLRKNRIENITPLTKMSRLTYLYLKDNPVKDYLPLLDKNIKREHTDVGEYITPIEWADSSLGSALKSVTGISDRKLVAADFETLDELNLDNKSISNISDLANMTGLKKLSLNGNSIRDLSPLASLTELEELSLDSNKITDINPLRPLKKLKKLSINGNPLEDYYYITELTGLTELSASDTTDMIFYYAREMPGLTKVTVNNCGISYVGEFTNYDNLTYLSLDGNSISNVENLAKLKNLTYLSIRDNSIRDYSGLTALKNLKTLQVEGNPGEDFSQLNGLPADVDTEPKPPAAKLNFADCTSDIKGGSDADKVKTVQNALIRLGYLSGAADGSYGSMTTDAVKRFQQKNGVSYISGVATRFTQALLLGDSAISSSDGTSRETTVTGKHKLESSNTMTYKNDTASIPITFINKEETPVVGVRFNFLMKESDGNCYAYGDSCRYNITLGKEQSVDMTIAPSLDDGERDRLSTIEWYISEILYEDGQIYCFYDPTKDVENQGGVREIAHWW